MPSSIVKRQRRRRKEAMDAGGDPEFQVAPMVDVLLVLLLFFMSITSTEVLKKIKNLQLAEAKNAAQKDPTPKTNEIVINVAWEPFKKAAIFTMDGVEYSTAKALEGLVAARSKQNPQAYVLIRADRDLEYIHTSELMRVCAEAGIGTVTFAVISGGTVGHPDTPPAAH